MITGTVSSKGQITIPKRIREFLDVETVCLSTEGCQSPYLWKKWILLYEEGVQKGCWDDCPRYKSWKC